MQERTILRPEGYMGHDKGPMRFTWPQAQQILHQHVIIRDWYGEVRCSIDDIHRNENTGFLLSVALTTESGHRVPEFKMNLVYEIEVV